ncbi:MAG: phosphatidylserine decarboxylase [Erysipelotrichales bacterium]|nr:phosphatidylserine decarboxylase [Erysipelotrichales bacterium]
MFTEESKTLKFLYTNVVGRCTLKVLTWSFISKLCGFFLDTRLSKFLIKPFVKKNNINLDDYYSENFKCFNDCFSRKIKEGKRTIDDSEDTIISPSDGLVSAYKISDDLILNIKNSKYTVSSLLKNDELSKKYINGTCIVIRLCVNHYHRYCYPVGGTKKENIHIKGALHTVRPIALENTLVFSENTREYTVLKSDRFGDIIMMEVGALLVGKIKNFHDKHKFKKGEEKGMFLYGGSTIILFLEDKVRVDNRFFKATDKGLEESIRMGEVLGNLKR